MTQRTCASLVRTPSEWSTAISRVEDAGGGDVYFRLDYMSLYNSPDSRAEAFIFEQGGETFFLPYILRPISSDILDDLVFDFESAYGYGGPLATSSSLGFLENAWRNFHDFCIEERIVAGFLRFHPLLANYRFADPTIVSVVMDRETVAISLDASPDEVWQGYSQDTRNKVRKGQKMGVTVDSVTGIDSLLDFFHLYEHHMEELEAHSSYFFGEDYFRSIHQLGDKSYRVYRAKIDDEVLGAALVLFSSHYAHYHLSSSPRRYNAYATNTMLRHAVTCDLLGSGRKMLHFGGGRTPSPQDGLLKFKSGFSRERRTFHIGTFVGNGKIYKHLCEHWHMAHPELEERFGKYFLCYRYL